MSIIIHSGSFYILRRKTGSKILKKDFCLLKEKVSNCQSKHVFISEPIPTLRKGIKSFSRLGLLTLASLNHDIKFIDNFNIFFNCKDRFKPDGDHPNFTGSRLLGTNLYHALGMPYQNKTVWISAKDKDSGLTACVSHLTIGSTSHKAFRGCLCPNQGSPPSHLPLKE